MTKKKVSKEECIAFLEEIADIVPSRIEGDDGMEYVSKFDGSYLTRVGMEDLISFMVELGITHEVQASNKGFSIAQLGYSPTENKWYGWSHRAVAGFAEGSECKKGHLHYIPDNEENFIEDMINFFTDEYKTVTGQKTQADGKWGVLLSYSYNDTVPNEKLRSTIDSVFQPFPDKWGRGEWTAKTLADAKQMAIDFAEGVS